MHVELASMPNVNVATENVCILRVVHVTMKGSLD